MNGTSTNAPLEKVRQLERRHVEVHLQLLKALDELYLTKEDRQNFVLTKEQESQLEDRHMLQMSLEKSIAISKAIRRNLQQSPMKLKQDGVDLDTTTTTCDDDDDGGGIGVGITTSNNIIISTTSEDKLASELIKLSEDNFTLDSKLIETLEPLQQLSHEYNKRRQEFDRLKAELDQLISNLPLEETKDEAVTGKNDDTADLPTSSSSTDADIQLERENTTLIELITALTHLSRRSDT